MPPPQNNKRKSLEMTLKDELKQLFSEFEDYLMENYTSDGYIKTARDYRRFRKHQTLGEFIKFVEFYDFLAPTKESEA